MNVGPVIQRELRGQSRHALTWWSRWAGALTLLALGVLYVIDTPGRLMAGQGGQLFTRMAYSLYLGMWLIGPLITADALSRERRQGTLGLLFLTPLHAWEIVAAKATLSVLRLVVVLIAAVPVLILPVLMGGVDWRVVCLALLMVGGAAVVTLGAGLLASSHNRGFTRALAWAYVWAVAGLALSAVLLGMVLNAVQPQWAFEFRPMQWMALGLTWLFWVQFDAVANPLPAAMAGGLPNWMLSGGIVAAATGAIGALMHWVAVVNLRRNWRESPPSPMVSQLQRNFCTPRIAVGYYRRWTRRQLERNPVGWLEKRTWQARVLTWSWLAVLTCIYTFALFDSVAFSRSFHEVQRTLSTFLLCSLLLVSAGSFRRERETGVLELLLVSPLSIGRIVVQRVRAIWSQFFLAASLIGAVWIYLGTVIPGSYDSGITRWGSMLQSLGFTLEFAAAYACLPLIGLYSSLRSRHYLVCLAWTMVYGMILPYLLPGLWNGLVSYYLNVSPGWAGQSSDIYAPLWTVTALQMVSGAIAGVLLARRLRRRAFVESTAGATAA